MDRVHMGGPWTGSTWVVHGPGLHGWSMDPGPCFVYVPVPGCQEAISLRVAAY